ncbi:MAG: HEAT repeat domain-containing protein, partial [Candidatus Thorarchaeota archaeon]|nr:HEAT repeat domain-containing protein [Candidatus Thorarchaeota archaeon]
GIEAVGGTDSDVFAAFKDLAGRDIDEIRAEATEKTIDLLNVQIEKENSFFMDIERMITSPFAILVPEVIESRKAELDTLGDNPTRNDVLSTYYGFTILTLSGLQSRSVSDQRYWRRRRSYDTRPSISEGAKLAIEQLSNDFGSQVNMKTRYETLGGSGFLAKKCNKEDRFLLSNVIRMCLYMTPWHRQKAALDLGKNGDSRILEFMHHRLEIETDRKTRFGIITGIGEIGHPDSIEHLMKISQSNDRYVRQGAVCSVEAIGKIYTEESSSYLNRFLDNRSNQVIASAIQGLSRINEGDLIPTLKPLLKHPSRPVMRAVIEALLNEGQEGRNVVYCNWDSIISKIFNDKASRSLLEELLKLPKINSSHTTHDYFAKRIVKQVNMYKKRYTQYYNNHYVNRWRKKRLTDLTGEIRLACEMLVSPYSHELINAIRFVFHELNEDSVVKEIISNSPLMNAIIQRAPYGELHHYI